VQDTVLYSRKQQKTIYLDFNVINASSEVGDEITFRTFSYVASASLKLFVVPQERLHGWMSWILVITVRYNNQTYSAYLLCPYPVSWNTPWGIWLAVHHMCETGIFGLGKCEIHHVPGVRPTMPSIGEDNPVRTKSN